MSGKLRIISGRWRGRKLVVPNVSGLRPSGDRTREVLFNWLQGLTNGARCLDLFAGTGALGLEAASRGAASVVLVERDRRLCERLRKIADEWPDGAVLDVVQGDAPRWLEQASGPFDIAFLDPPFSAGLHGAALQALIRPGLLAPDAMIYVESDARAAAPFPVSDANEKRPNLQALSPCSAGQSSLAPASWRIHREKKLGEVRMQLLRTPESDPRAERAPSYN